MSGKALNIALLRALLWWDEAWILKIFLSCPWLALTFGSSVLKQAPQSRNDFCSAMGLQALRSLLLLTWLESSCFVGCKHVLEKEVRDNWCGIVAAALQQGLVVAIMALSQAPSRRHPEWTLNETTFNELFTDSLKENPNLCAVRNLWNRAPRCFPASTISMWFSEVQISGSDAHSEEGNRRRKDDDEIRHVNNFPFSRSVISIPSSSSSCSSWTEQQYR